MMKPMEVQLTPDQQAKLSRLAAAQGCAAETLVQEAVDRLLNYDDWFLREVDTGLAAADSRRCRRRSALPTSMAPFLTTR